MKSGSAAHTTEYGIIMDNYDSTPYLTIDIYRMQYENAVEEMDDSDIRVLTRSSGLIYNDGMKSVAVYSDAETVLPSHLHFFTAPQPFRGGGPTTSLFYITEGCMWLDHPDGPAPVRNGDICIRGPHCRSEIYTEGPITLYHYYFYVIGGQLEVLHDNLHDRARSIYYASDPAQYARTLLIPDVLHLSQSARTEALLVEIYREKLAGNPGSALQIQADMLRLLNLVSQESIATLKREAVSGDEQAVNRHIERAVAFVEANLASTITLRDVAAQLEINADYLGRLFQRYLSESVGGYLMRRRLAMARQLLATTTLSVKQVALQVGFTDPLYFSRIFRREEGCSPREFQREQQYAMLSMEVTR